MEPRTEQARQAELTARLRETLEPYLGEGGAAREVRDLVERGTLDVESPEESGDVDVRAERFGRSAAREVQVEPVLREWTAELREQVFGGPEAPFATLAKADAEWIEPAREAILGPASEPISEDEALPGDEALDREEALRALRRLHREVEEEFGVRLPDPYPEREFLELPREEGWSPEGVEEVVERRIPLVQAGSQHFAVARAVRQMAEWSGYRPGALTRYVLTGEEPALDAATLEVRTVNAPSASGGEVLFRDRDPLRAQRHVVLRLNEPPTVRRLEEIASKIRDRWEAPGAFERRALRQLVEEELTAEERDSARRDVWEPIAEAWNRGRPEEERVGWRAVQMRYKNMEA